MKYLTINNERIPVQVRKAKGKRVSLGFAQNVPSLVINVPGGKVTPEVKAFLLQKRSWIWKHYSRLKVQFARREHFYEKISKGEGLYLGDWYPLKVYKANAFGVNVSSEEIQLSLRNNGNLTLTTETLAKAYRQLAKTYLIPRTWEWADKTDSKVQKIFVKNHRSKWGSCSSKSNINLNWHLIFLPESLVDYLIIHELMHLREMNHSLAYWNWVAMYYPNYKAANKLLNEYNWVIGLLETE